MGMVTKIGQWLDSRFPAKVTVTKEDFDMLSLAIGQCGSLIKDIDIQLNKKVVDLELKINAIVEKDASYSLKLMAELEDVKAELSAVSDAVKNVRLMNGIQSNASKFINDYKR